MFNCDILIIDRDLNFNSMIKPQIKKGMKILLELNNAPFYEKNKILEKYYNEF